MQSVSDEALVTIVLVMLRRKSRFAQLFLHDFPHATLSYCGCDKLELEVTDAADEAVGLKRLHTLCDILVFRSLYYRSPKHQDELITCFHSLHRRLSRTGTLFSTR
jgi:hypothetical protein